MDLWIEIDWIMFFIKFSTKLDFSLRSTPVQFVYSFLTMLRSMLVVIDNY